MLCYLVTQTAFLRVEQGLFHSRTQKNLVKKSRLLVFKNSRWFSDERNAKAKRIKKLVDEGVYPNKLF